MRYVFVIVLLLLIGCDNYVDATREVLHSTQAKVDEYANNARTRDSLEVFTARDERMRRAVCDSAKYIVPSNGWGIGDTIKFSRSEYSTELFSLEYSEYVALMNKCDNSWVCKKGVPCKEGRFSKFRDK